MLWFGFEDLHIKDLKRQLTYRSTVIIDSNHRVCKNRFAPPDIICPEMQLVEMRVEGSTSKEIYDAYQLEILRNI